VDCQFCLDDGGSLLANLTVAKSRNAQLWIPWEGAARWETRVLKGWVEEIESEVLEYLRGHQPTSLPNLASALRISEALALSYISILAREGKVFIGGLGIRGN
jgi:hypothetical protein